MSRLDTISYFTDLTLFQKINTAKSMLIISTPEGTAMDLMNYPKQSGGLNHVAIMLSELQEFWSYKKNCSCFITSCNSTRQAIKKP